MRSKSPSLKYSHRRHDGSREHRSKEYRPWIPRPRELVVVRNRSPNRPFRSRNVARCRERLRKTRVWRHLAASRYPRTGFRFRYRKVWGFKSLLVPSGPRERAFVPEEDSGLRFALRAQLSAQVPTVDHVASSERARSCPRRRSQCWLSDVCAPAERWFPVALDGRPLRALG